MECRGTSIQVHDRPLVCMRTNERLAMCLSDMEKRLLPLFDRGTLFIRRCTDAASLKKMQLIEALE